MLNAIGIFYPGPPEVAYSSLAYHLLKGYLNEVLRLPVYSYFFDGEEVYSLERSPDPSKLKLIFISISYELLYPIVVNMLRKVDINPDRRVRKFPILVGGGPPLTANPLPLFNVLDAIVIGEAEPVIDDLVNQVVSCSDKNNCLERLTDVSGILVPEFPKVVEKVHVQDLNNSWHPAKLEMKRGIEPVWGKSYLLESSRGCGRGCRFCLEGYIFRPPRHRKFNVMKDLLEDGIKVNKVSKVSFYSLSFFDNPDADEILNFAVNEKNLNVSVPSLRVETLSRERAELIAKGGQKTITMAPETGSERIARALNKVIDKDLLITAVEEALDAGIKSMKLYIIVAVPGESKEDIDETILLVDRVSSLVRSKGGSLKVSVNPLIPKPYTPLQWLGFNLRSAEKSLSLVKRSLRKKGIDVRAYNPKHAALQALLALGTEDLSEVLINLKGGGLGLRAFMNEAKALKVNIEDVTKPKKPQRIPPWHKYVINRYANLDFLRREFQTFLKIMALS